MRGRSGAGHPCAQVLSSLVADVLVWSGPGKGEPSQRQGRGSNCFLTSCPWSFHPSSALKSREILHFSTSMPNLFLENKAKAPPAF